MRLFSLLAIGLVFLVGCQSDPGTATTTPATNPSSDMILFKDANGNTLTAQDLEGVTGTFGYQLLGSENVPETAQALHEVARKFGQQGMYDKATASLLEAHEQAPNWPYPVYDLGYTYLLQDSFDLALKYYRLTDSLAPRGFFTSKTAFYTLDKESKGEYKKGLYRMYISLEWVESQEQKMQLVELLLQQYPNYAPAWEAYANLLDGAPREDALDKGLALETDLETKGSLMINKALMLNYRGQSDSAKAMLGQVIFDPQSTFGNVEKAKFVMKAFAQQ